MFRLLLRFRLFQRLMGFTPPEPPLTGRAEVNGVQYDVDTISRDETAISIHLPRLQMVVPPAYFRKDDETFNPSHRFHPLIDCLFKLGACAVDIGTRDDKIAAIFQHKIVSVDKSAVDRAVAVMVNLRDQVAGSHRVAPSPRDPVAESSVEIDSHAVAVQLYAARIDANEDDGTFGNIDLCVTTKPAIPRETILQNVHIIIPGHDTLLDASGHSLLDAGAELGFGLLDLASELGYSADQERQEWLRQMVTTMTHVDVVWSAEETIPLGTVPCFRSQPN